MPIYEYECRKCKNRTAILQKVNDKPPTKCLKCGGRLDKLISASAIQFKGSGWYVTDYADKKATKSEKSESEPSSEKKTETKTESKSKESSPAKKTSEKTSPPKASGD